MSGGLAGRAVLVTRPAGLGARLVELLRARGGEAVLFPAIEILPPGDPAKLRDIIARLDRFDLAVFVSPTAVARAVEAVTAVRTWPARLVFAAVGSGSARALSDAGIAAVLAPRGRGDSDALAALPEMQAVRGMRVVIFRGEGGRETLRDTLAARGAEVEYAECYRRGLPRADVAPLVARWRGGGIAAACVTSSEGLENLLALLGDSAAGLLRATPVFVPHPRVADRARARGVAQVIVTGPGDEDLAEALAGFFARV